MLHSVKLYKHVGGVDREPDGPGENLRVGKDLARGQDPLPRVREVHRLGAQGAGRGRQGA